MSKWRPISTAKREKGARILAHCDAAESRSGIQEMEWDGKRWWYVIDHDWPNMCPNPTHWQPVMRPPHLTESSGK